jgi:Uma2 family endonuclease
MSAAAPVRRLTEAEYLEFERRADVRHEFSDGEVFAMAGGTFAHSQIAGNLIRSIGNRLPIACAVLTADMRVKCDMTGLYTYPDVSVVRGERRFLDDRQDTLLNPVMVVEVLSDATEAYDRGRKFEHYRRIPSLRGYLLVRQD